MGERFAEAHAPREGESDSYNDAAQKLAAEIQHYSEEHKGSYSGMPLSSMDVPLQRITATGDFAGAHHVVDEANDLLPDKHVNLSLRDEPAKKGDLFYPGTYFNLQLKVNDESVAKAKWVHLNNT